MNYVQASQLPTCTHHIRESINLLLIHLIVICVVSGALYVLILMFITYAIREYILSYDIIFLLVFLTHFIIYSTQLFFLSYVVLHRTSDEYYMSGNHLIVYKGIFHLDEKVYELYQIQSVRLYQTFIGKIFHYGDVVLHFGSRGFTEIVTLRGIADPKKYQRIFRESIPQLNPAMRVP